MSVEPKQSMEDQLRAYAESRRLEAAPGFELDPPVRRRLQDEVRRVYHATVSPTSAAVSRWFWVRMALVGASAAVVLFMSARFLRTEKEIVLSQAADRPVEMAALDEARESADVGVPDRQSREAEPGSEVVGSPVPTSQTARSLAPTIVRVPAAAEPRRQQDKDGLVVRGVEPVATPMATMPSAEGEIAYGVAADSDAADVAGQPLTQEFQQIQRYRRNPNSPMPPQVLQSFRWIREGDAVRVIDADGSVYTGGMGVRAVRPAVAPESLSAQSSRDSYEREARPGLELRQPGLDGAVVGEQFAVMGTNRTLNVRVEFEGMLVPQMGISQAPTDAGGVEQSTVAEAGVQIQGQALVGGRTRLGIVANPRLE
jgi:hypothetical protein